jgi:hypothetical protein
MGRYLFPVHICNLRHRSIRKYVGLQYNRLLTNFNLLKLLSPNHRILIEYDLLIYFIIILLQEFRVALAHILQGGLSNKRISTGHMSRKETHSLRGRYHSFHSNLSG